MTEQSVEDEPGEVPTGVPDDVVPKDEIAVSTDSRGAWSSGPGIPDSELDDPVTPIPDAELSEEIELRALKARHPAWAFWRGDHTGAWWACSSWASPLIEATTAEVLEAKVEAAERERQGFGGGD